MDNKPAPNQDLLLAGFTTPDQLKAEAKRLTAVIAARRKSLEGASDEQKARIEVVLAARQATLDAIRARLGGGPKEPAKEGS